MADFHEAGMDGGVLGGAVCEDHLDALGLEDSHERDVAGFKGDVALGGAGHDHSRLA